MEKKESEKIIRGKKILLVDDEKDVLDTLVELLSICKLDTALSFEEGKRLIEDNNYDIVILDIMGVRGFDLLGFARKRNIPVLMLTAHSLSEKSLKQSFKEGASYFVPKDEIENIVIYVADVVEAIQRNKNPWIKLMERLGSFYDKRFSGTNWREKELEYLLKKGDQ